MSMNLETHTVYIDLYLECLNMYFQKYTPYTPNYPLYLFFRTHWHTENTRSCLCSFVRIPHYTCMYRFCLLIRYTRPV